MSKSRAITHEQRISFYRAQQEFMRERDKLRQEISVRETRLEALEVGMKALENMLADYKVKP